MFSAVRSHYRIISFLFGLIVTGLFYLWTYTSDPFWSELRLRNEWLAYDVRLVANIGEPPPTHAQVVIIDIDEKSLAAEGHWPWQRQKVSRLLENLVQANVAVIALDIVFPEEQPNAAALTRNVLLANQGSITAEVDQQLTIAEEQLDEDNKLGAIISNFDITTGFVFTEGDEQRGMLPDVGQVMGLSPKLTIPIHDVSGYVSNISEIQENAHSSGFFTTVPDDDGVLRNYSLVMTYQRQMYPSLALEAVRLFYLADSIDPIVVRSFDNSLLEGIEVADVVIPTDPTGRILIPFNGEPGQFERISAERILNNRFDRNKIEGKIAIVGSTAQALFDFRSTPVHPYFPGVEVHATVISALLSQSIPQRPSWVQGLNTSILGFFGLLLSFLLPRIRALLRALLTLTSLVLIIFISNLAWAKYGLALSLTIPALLVLVLGIFNIFMGYILESFNRRRLSDRFGEYVPKALVKQMNQSEKDFGFDGERRELTVLFADIRGFTSLSEGKDPQVLKNFLNAYFTPMTEVIFNTQGTIDKYIGDMIMAFWGAPVQDPQHAINAIKGAMQMHRKAAEMRNQFAELGFENVEIGIGINSGDMSVGNMGSKWRKAYTVLGDAVNLGSRIESLTKHYGVNILVGENCYELARGAFVFRKIDCVSVKGKDEPVNLYQPLCETTDLESEKGKSIEALQNKARFEAALEMYQRGEWSTANAVFESLNNQNPCTLYRLYLDRTKNQNPPNEWNGVFIHLSK